MIREVVWGQASTGFRNVGILARATICTEEARLLGQRSSRPRRAVLNALGPDEAHRDECAGCELTNGSEWAERANEPASGCCSE
eukprot:499124-Rhodomonas_salina.1